MSFSKVIFAWLACASLAHASGNLVLAPGTSVTLIDASDPSMHVVVTAPGDAALDLGALLAARGKSSILSIVTGAQLRSGGGMVKNADGTISIAPSAAAAIPQASLADRAVLVFNEGRYVGVAEQMPGAPTAASAVRSSAPISVSNPVAPSPGSSPSRLPGPAPVVTGTASIASPAPSLSVDQTQRGVINWGQFNIGSGGSINVTQPQPSTVTTLRVNGPSATQIPGILTSNGAVTLTAPNGVPAAGSISVGGGAITTTGAAAPGAGITSK